MTKHLKSNEVISSISEKIELKKQLRLAKKNHDDLQIQKLTHKISKIEHHLQSTPLSKT